MCHGGKPLEKQEKRNVGRSGDFNFPEDTFRKPNFPP